MGTTDSKEAIPMEVEAGSSTAQSVSFDVILSPKVENAKMPQLTPKRTGIATKQEFDEKMEAVERRRKNREDEIRQKLSGEDDHVMEVCQAMSEYKERKKLETETRYQRRLFTFAQNQESIANERTEQWEERTRRIFEARTTVRNKERSFREMVKEKLLQKFENFKEHQAKYHVSRQEAAQLKNEKLDAVRSSKEKKIEERATATAEKMRRKAKASEENREATINEKLAKSQEKQLKVERTKEALERSMEVSSCKKMMEINERLDMSAKKRQNQKRKVREKVKEDLEKVKEVKRLCEQRERRFSDCTGENLRMKFEKAEEIRESNVAARQEALQEKMERAQKVKSAASQSDELRGKIEEKMHRLEENRSAILNAKVEQCQKESVKVKNTKENGEEKIRSHEKATDEKLQTKLEVYRENRQQRLSERKEKSKVSQDKRPSLQEITNDDTKQTIKILKDLSSVHNDENTENDYGNFQKLAENFRNRNLEYLSLR